MAGGRRLMKTDFSEYMKVLAKSTVNKIKSNLND